MEKTRHIWDLHSGRVLPVEEPKTSEGLEVLQQSHPSLPEVTTEQSSFALMGIVAVPQEGSPGNPQTDPAPLAMLRAARLAWGRILLELLPFFPALFFKDNLLDNNF